MKKLLVSLLIGLGAAAFVFAGSASAQQGKSLTPQQQKFANCAHESKGTKGEAHKEFMSKCLKGESTSGMAKSEESAAMSKAQKTEEKAKSATTEQREKMKSCNAQAKEKSLKGKDRRSFMSECLKG